MYCNETIASKVRSVYLQDKTDHRQVHINKCKYTYADSQLRTMLKDSDDDNFSEVYRRDEDLAAPLQPCCGLETKN